jgi:hypothetical protein
MVSISTVGAHFGDDLFEACPDPVVDDLLVVLGAPPGVVGAPVSEVVV